MNDPEFDFAVSQFQGAETRTPGFEGVFLPSGTGTIKLSDTRRSIWRNSPKTLC